MGTEILTIAPEMAEIIEVEMVTFSTEIIFLSSCQFPNEGCQLQLQFSQPFLHQFSKSQCPSTRGVPEDSETLPTCKIRIILSQVTAIDLESSGSPLVDGHRDFQS